jgi:hypothetical protein
MLNIISLSNSYVGAIGSGGTILLQESFEDTNWTARGWYDQTANVTIANDAAPGDGSHCLWAHWNSGATNPWGSGAFRHSLSAISPTLYVSFWVKYSANWIGSGFTFHPHEINILSNLDGAFDGLSDNWLNAYIEENYQNGGIPRIAFQDSKNINVNANVFRTGSGTINGTDAIANTESRSECGANGGVENGVFWEAFAQGGNLTGYYNDKRIDNPTGVAFQPNPGTGYKNNWNHVEVYFAMNSVTNNIAHFDGILQYSFNGTLLINRADMMYRTGINSTMSFAQFIFAPYMGNGSPTSQDAFYDNLVVATAHP